MGGRLAAAAVVLVLGGCGTPASTTGISYERYTYTCCVELTSITVWHPGERLTLHWQARPGGQSASNTPRTVSLGLSLTGPFLSVEALKQAIVANRLPAGVRTVTAASQSVSDRSAGSPVSELDLPSDLAPGYYNLAPTVRSGGVASDSGAVVTVQ